MRDFDYCLSPKSPLQERGLGRYAPNTDYIYFFKVNNFIRVVPTGRVLSDLAPDGTENASIYLISDTDRQSLGQFTA